MRSSPSTTKRSSLASRASAMASCVMLAVVRVVVGHQDRDRLAWLGVDKGLLLGAPLVSG